LYICSHVPRDKRLTKAIYIDSVFLMKDK
jgi:hypothetical protein